ncbi:MAG: 5-formyltetrahydrofolate cyclo-ligase [Betaproteobacteria bacterium]
MTDVLPDRATIPTAGLREQKKALRVSALAARDAMPAAARQSAGEAIMQRIYALDVYRNAQSVAMYMSIGTELDTHVFFDRVLADGKQVALPRIDKASKSIRLHLVGGHRDLADGVWGIREPHADAPVVNAADIDLMLMPGVAFDLFGHRLGYGAGYYDRLVAPLGAKPVRVAAAFDCQVVNSVPAGADDQPFHILITERQMLRLSC